MNFEKARVNLIKNLSAVIADKKVLKAMSDVPREDFVPSEMMESAYEDRPLPIGLGQTISQPFIIALMTQTLALSGNEKVLEVGSGSGYQTAILAKLSRWVVSVERLAELAGAAKKKLDELGYKNIDIHVARDTLGWLDEAPYDAIMVTAGAPCLPESLLDQLKKGGRMVIPVGPYTQQELYCVTKQKNRNKIEKMGGCRFVPLIAKDAWMEEWS
jgi:protein-L-isoaspartate(D-aspartate) O-methyltransferase